MPSPSVLAARKARLAQAGITGPRLMPEVFASKNDQSGTQEDRRRRIEVPLAAAPAAIPALGGAIPVSTGSTMITKSPPVPIILDRFHKWSVNDTGGYIIVGLGHSKKDLAGQFPPINPGAMYLGTVPSITDAYMMAVAEMTAVAPTGRITICIMAGSWHDTFVVTVPGIDFWGIGQPTNTGQIIISSLSDAKCYNIDFYATQPQGGLWIQPGPDPNPQQATSRIYRCNFYGDSVAMTAERRFYAEDCHWYRTGGQLADPYTNYNENDIPLIIHLNGGERGPTRLKDCSIHARLRQQDVVSSVADPTYGGQPDTAPLGYAFKVQSLAQGSFNISGAGFGNPGGPFWTWPSSFVELDHCEVLGSLRCIEARVEHSNCDVHGGVWGSGGGSRFFPPSSTPVIPGTSGAVYAIISGQPIFDPVNGYIADRPGWVTFDNTPIRSFQIAQARIYDGVYPGGVSPSSYPGYSLVEMSNCGHHVPFSGGPGSAFNSDSLGNGIAIVADSPTAAANWPNVNWQVGLYGSCPTLVPLYDFYNI